MVGKDFEVIDHTADVGVVAYGANLSQAFANAARALFSLITELESVRETLSRGIELEAPDEESLLVEWLNELIYLFDTENILFKRFEVTELKEGRLKARGYGEKVDSSRHQLKTGIKAATYHMLSVGKDDDGGYRVQVIFDI
jgi:SHS2 domain-containing protein